MPAPFAPVAGVALKYLTVAAAGYALARMLPNVAPDPRAEAAMDEMPDGFNASADEEATRAGFRLRRAIRIGTVGAKIDAALLARLKVART